MVRAKKPTGRETAGRERKTTGKQGAIATPAAAKTQIADMALRPPAKRAGTAPIEERTRRKTGRQGALAPVAPTPAATLVGRPQTAKPPAPPVPARRAKPPPPPKPGEARKLDADPAKLKAGLDAVLAKPDDDDARATYAALLSAAGDPRGDFITVGLQLAQRGDRTEREDPGSEASWNRFRELQQRNAAKWTKAVKALGKQTRWRWHRGFVHELRLNGWEAGCTPGNLAVVLATEPVVELSIEGCDPDLLPRLLAVPGIERVKRLAVSAWNASDQGTFVGRAVAKASRLGKVSELRIGIKLGDAGVIPLLEAKSLDRVEHLALGAPEASVETYAALAASPLGQRLEVLEILRDDVTPAMAKLIVMMPCLHTFVGSTGHVGDSRDALSRRFRARFVVEDAPGTQYLIDGVKGVTHRPVPKR